MPASVKQYNKRLESLRSERSTFFPLWQELSDYNLGHRGRFLTSDRNKGYKRNTKQINNTSRMAVRTLAGGMMAGITSPARPWFRLGITDRELREYKSVKEWLDQVQALMYRVYSASNTYNVLHQIYSELGVFGGGVMGVFDNYDNVINCMPYTIGSYLLASNGENKIDTFYREYEITVAQCVKQFGYENCSVSVRNQWDNGGSENWVQVVHVIEPNDDRDLISPLAKHKRFRSVYYEKSSKTAEKENEFLRQSGFDIFPILAPRWEVVGEDVYATDSPGITSLGDTKALQLGEMRKYQVLDKLVKPKLQAPATLRNSTSGAGLDDEDVVWTNEPTGGVRSVYEVRPDLNAMQAINQEAEMRIKRAYYEDMFLMLSQSDRAQITAREVAEKHEEKLLMLGPVLERLHSELLDPLIDITFNKLQTHGALPPAPKEIQGKEIDVEYVSILAQAQRMVAVSGLERIGAYVGQIASVWPEARHKFDPLQAVDEYAEALGVAPSVIKGDDEVNAAIAAERQAAQQQAVMQQNIAMADAAKTASEADTSGDNGLTRLMQRAGLQ